jgi:hypothetical protein
MVASVKAGSAAAAAVVATVVDAGVNLVLAVVAVAEKAGFSAVGVVGLKAADVLKLGADFAAAVVTGKAVHVVVVSVNLASAAELVGKSGFAVVFAVGIPGLAAGDVTKQAVSAAPLCHVVVMAAFSAAEQHSFDLVVVVVEEVVSVASAAPSVHLSLSQLLDSPWQGGPSFRSDDTPGHLVGGFLTAVQCRRNNHMDLYTF